jgi:SWI/SNF-related matrix-associated actin-dependent regulator of chromatin subfamily A member 5
VAADVNVVITTYETLTSDSHRLSRLGIWKAVVLDEGHKIRNDTKKGSAALSRLKTDQRIILTG